MSKKVILACVVFLFGALIMANAYFLKAPGPVVYEEVTEEKEDIVIGFSQVGAESDWRSANTKSMQETFSGKGYTLFFDDAQQKQSNQITAIRKFIQQEVDYIVLAPVTETGWDTVFMEAKEAGIPVILVDRMVNVEDESLYTCWIGSDFYLEGDKACEWLNAFATANGIKGEDLHIVDIQGTIGATAQLGRSAGLNRGAMKYGWDIVAYAEGEFTQAKGYEVTNQLLKEHDDINVIYCENDNEALGAIKAVEDNGKKVGSDIKKGEILIISFDGVSEEAVDHAINGEISCLVECNPLHGPRVKNLIDTLEKGETPSKRTYIEEDIYSGESAVKRITIDGIVYSITPITNKNIKNKL